MQINIKKLIFITCFFISSCVTFNDIHVKKPLNDDLVCANISLINLTQDTEGVNVKEVELDILSQKKIFQVLKHFNILSTCENNKINIQVKIHQKTSKAYQVFIGVWSVVTVLTAGLVPSYSSFDTDIYLYQDNAKVTQTQYHYSSAVWLPFVVKQAIDDSYSFENYDIDSRSAVIGLEIAQIIRSYLILKK